MIIKSINFRWSMMVTYYKAYSINIFVISYLFEYFFRYCWSFLFLLDTINRTVFFLCFNRTNIM